MNRELYQGLLGYLENLHIPKDMPIEFSQQIQQMVKNYFRHNGLLYQRHKPQPRLVIPETKLQQVLKLCHDHPLAGHMGIDNTFQRLQQQYYWPKMYEDIRAYVQQCDVCQKRKGKREATTLEPISPPLQPFAHIGIDVVGPLPITQQENRYIITAIDYLTKWPEARAVVLADSLNIADFIYTDIICRHGVPQEITTDQGTEFNNELLRTLWKKFKVKHITTTAYHPQGNGLVERFNQTLKNILAKLTIQHKNDWDHHLNSALFAIRTMRQESTRFTPFELTYGRLANLPHLAPALIPTEEPLENRLEQELQHLQRIRTTATGFIKKAQERQKKNYNRAHKAEELQIGDMVLLYRSNIETSWSAKLEPKWEGPYYIHNIYKTSYRLRHPNGIILDFNVHRNRLKKYYPDPRKYPVSQV